MVTHSELAPQPRIQALARASAIIDVIAAGGAEGVRLGDVSRLTSLNKTTAFNLLASLVTLRFIEQDEQTRRYRLGLRNIELGRIVQHQLYIPNLARPILVDLCKKSNETVSLALPDMLDLLVVDSFRGSRFLQSTAYAGVRSPYHCTALGKSALSRMSKEMRETVYRLRGLPQLTRYTITVIDQLEAQLPQIREQGFAFDIQENEEGVNCVGTSIIDGFGEVGAAISVSGPSHRMSADTLKMLSKDLIVAADAIAAAIGLAKQSERKELLGAS